MPTPIANMLNGRQLFTSRGAFYSCPTHYAVADITREDMERDCCIKHEASLAVVWVDDEPVVFRQIATIDIADSTFGVCERLTDDDGLCVCLDGHPSETVYTRDNIHTDEDRAAERAMIAAGFWHS